LWPDRIINWYWGVAIDPPCKIDALITSTLVDLYSILSLMTFMIAVKHNRVNHTNLFTFRVFAKF